MNESPREAFGVTKRQRADTVKYTEVLRLNAEIQRRRGRKSSSHAVGVLWSIFFGFIRTRLMD